MENLVSDVDDISEEFWSLEDSVDLFSTIFIRVTKCIIEVLSFHRLVYKTEKRKLPPTLLNIVGKKGGYSTELYTL